uniref:MI domain-containing protein n=1 Tax=Anopheles christyi TaxID=43041 RepID=A0A182JQZ5_9DIPT
MKFRRPPKNVRQGNVGRNVRNKSKASVVKTRKDLRKEKRQLKKVNRFNYHNRSRKDQQQGVAEGRQKHGDKFGNDHSGDESEEFEDEEIPSDFSDQEEKEEKVVGQNSKKQSSKTKKTSYTSQMDVEREKEMIELRRYEEGLKSNRIKQLEAANEDDDRIIQKYEKLLKINRRKNKEGIPKSFNDGLDYALELCTDDSIRKMYDAAKEAAELEENSTDEFVEDLKEAVGGKLNNESKAESESSKRPKKGKGKLTEKEKNRVEKLKKIEEKYFGLDEMDDDLGEYDSEMELEMDENGDDSDFSENDELYDFNEEETLDSEEDEDEKKKTGKRIKFATIEKAGKTIKKRKQTESDSEEDEYDDFDDDYSDSETEFSEESEPRKKVKQKVVKAKKGKKSKQGVEEEETEDNAGRFVLLKSRKDKEWKNGKQKKKKDTAKRNASSDSEEEPDFDEEEDFDEEDDGLDDLFDDDSGSDDPSDGEGKKQSTKSADGTWEDIYGRKRDKAGNIIKEETVSTPNGGKYVPPHMRAKLEAEAAAKGNASDPKQQERLQRLKRTLKGQINRLAESNVHRISITLDNLYMQHSRYDMNSTLTALILEATVVPTLTPERMILEHMLLVAILHANVGSEVGSHFLETVVERFLELLGAIETTPNEAKQLDNCVQLMSHLYTFDIVKCKMVHEVLQKLIECFNEKAVECILLVLRTVGFILRKDDPLALKELIIAIQKKAANAPDELKNDPRVKYMLETLLAVKNNNMNKIPQYDPTLVEHFRKLLKGMITSGKYVSTLNIGIQDILNIPERGKWWLVGSAWLGTKDSSTGANGKPATSSTGEAQYSEQLLELARQQRMNTDDRRNVFCIVMSAEDYLDAFEKLLRLAIKDLRILVSVIIHCSLAEKDYNPYYSVLAQKFCDYDRRYQLAIQYALWDRLKEIHSLQQQQVRNLARFITHVIGEGGLALSCLKVIDFAEIDKVNLRLMRQIMLGLLLMQDENKCLQVFSRISSSFKLKAFKDGIRLFMHHFLARGSSSHSSLPEEQVQLLQERIKQADELLATDTKIEYDV